MRYSSVVVATLVATRGHSWRHPSVPPAAAGPPRWKTGGKLCGKRYGTGNGVQAWRRHVKAETCEHGVDQFLCRGQVYACYVYIYIYGCILDYNRLYMNIDGLIFKLMKSGLYQHHFRLPLISNPIECLWDVWTIRPRTRLIQPFSRWSPLNLPNRPIQPTQIASHGFYAVRGATHVEIQFRLQNQFHRKRDPKTRKKNWLVVWTPLKNMKVNWDDYSQYMGT